MPRKGQKAGNLIINSLLKTKHYCSTFHMKSLKVYKLVSLLLAVSAGICLADFTVDLEGGPVAGDNPGVLDAAAPIYTLNGTAHADLDIFTSGVSVSQDLTFSMDNVNSGNVHTTGDVTITKIDIDGAWDATFLADSTYKISAYGSLIIVNFNHTVNKDPSEAVLIIDGASCDSGFITSKGNMILVYAKSEYSFTGVMSGSVKGISSGRIIRNYKYKDAFTQDFTDLNVEDQGIWSAEYEVRELAKNKLGGEGTVTVGPVDDPVDLVDQTVSGSASKGVFSWSTKSKSSADNKVKVTIKHTDTELVAKGKPNSVAAAAQTRKF